MTLNPGSTSGGSEIDLVRAALEGDRAAFDTLVERYFGLVYLVAYSRLGAREPAEDLAQEVFLKAYLHLDKLQSPEGFVSWLRSMTRNLAVDWFRKGHKSSELVSMVEAGAEVEALPDRRTQGAREAMEAKETRQLVRDAIQRLSPELRDVVLLHYMGDLSKSEVARQLGLHPATVGRQLKRARAELRGIIDPMLRETVREVGPRPAAVARTVAILAAASALPAASKAAVAAAAGSALSLTAAGAVQTGGAAASGLSTLLGWTQVLSTPIKVGGAAMGIGKGIAVAAAIIVVVGGGVVVYRTVGQGGNAPTPATAVAEARPAMEAPAAIPAAPPVASPTPVPTQIQATGYAKWVGTWISQGGPVLDKPMVLKVDLRPDGKPEFHIVTASERVPGDGTAELLKRFPNLAQTNGSMQGETLSFRPDVETAPGRMQFLSNRPDIPVKSELQYQADRDVLQWWMTKQQRNNQGGATEVKQGPWQLTRLRTPAGQAASGASEEIIRAAVSRSRTDQRSMATALEAFFVDHNYYPPTNPLGTAPFQITTPIAYATGNFPDPFSSTKGGSYRYYVSDDGHSWILISPGPDGTYDLTEKTYKDAARRAGPYNWKALQQLLAPYTYDPTNGTVSTGDIFRFKQ